MGSRTDAKIAAWQESAGLKPVIGERGTALREISRVAYDLIQVIELECSGIRDGDGSWHGSDALDGTIDKLKRLFDDEDLCPQCGAHMQATHHPACEAMDGTPSELDDQTVRAMTGTPIAEVADELPPWMDEKYDPPERRSKEGLLAHYADRNPKSFVQFDGWYGGKCAGDSVIATDEAGRSMTLGLTTELMNGADMRLLIEPDADPVEIVGLLHQAAEWITRAPHILSSRWHGSKLHLVDENSPEGCRARLEQAVQRRGMVLGHTDPVNEALALTVYEQGKDALASDDFEKMQLALAALDQFEDRAS